MTTEKELLPGGLVAASKLNADSYTLTEPFIDKSKRLKAYIQDGRLEKEGLAFMTPKMKTSYGFSAYTPTGGNTGYSTSVKFETIIENEINEIEIFKKFIEGLENDIKELFINKVSKLVITNPKEVKKLKQNPKVVQAYLNPIIKFDKNDVPEIKLKIRSNDKSLPGLEQLTVEKFKISDNDDIKEKISVDRSIVDLTKCENPTDVLKNHIRPGSYIQAVVTPSIYWVGNRFGVTLNAEALMVFNPSSTTVDKLAADLNPSSIAFTPPKKNKDRDGYSALVLDTDSGGLSGKIKTGFFKIPYGISEYENAPGKFDHSIVIMNQSNYDEFKDENQKFFDYSEALNEAALDYAEEHRDIIFKKPSNGEELSRDIIESAYFNPCVTQNKNGDDQIKLKIMKDDDGIPKFDCYEYDDINSEESKTIVDWSSFDNIGEDIKNLIRGGNHVSAIVQPRIYFISNKIGVNYRLIELNIVKNSYSKKNFNNVFSFADDVQQSQTNDSEVTIEEEEIEEEEVDSDAYGDDDDDDDDESEDEVVEASA